MDIRRKKENQKKKMKVQLIPPLITPQIHQYHLLFNFSATLESLRPPGSGALNKLHVGVRSLILQPTCGSFIVRPVIWQCTLRNICNFNYANRYFHHKSTNQGQFDPTFRHSFFFSPIFSLLFFSFSQSIFSILNVSNTYPSYATL